MAHTQPDFTQPASADVILALTEYRMEMLDLLRGMELPEAVKLGAQLMTSTLADKWPVSTGGLAYKEAVGDHPNLTSWGTSFFTLTTKSYSAGAIAQAERLRTTDWAAHGWGQLPAENAEALRFLFEELIADVLKNGATTPSWMLATKGVFDVDKPCDPANPNGPHKHSNLLTGTPLSVPNLDRVRRIGLTQKNASGRPRGLTLSHVICGPDLDTSLRSYLKDTAVVVVHGAGATETATMQSNLVATHYPGIQPLVLPLLDEEGVWYPVFARSGRMPWITLMKKWARVGAAPGMPATSIQAADGLEWITLDDTSDHYKYGSPVGPAGTVAQWSKTRLGAAIQDETVIWRCEP